MPERANSCRCDSASASSACFDALYGREPGRRDAAADRADVHDAAVPGAEQRDRGLRERDDAEEVDVEHPAPVFFADVLDRAADADARVVDERLEAAVADLARDLVDARGDVVAAC